MTDKDYLYELDQITLEVMKDVLKNQSLRRFFSMSELKKIRKQFITMNKLHLLDLKEIRPLFKDYLNKQI